MVDKKILKKLVPINSLNSEHVEQLASSTKPEQVPAGDVVFNEGEEDHSAIYLLQGEVELVTGSNVLKVLRGGDEATQHPLAPYQPRQVTAKAKTVIALLRFKSDLLDTFLTWDQSSGYTVEDIDEEEDEGDWMAKILQKEVFFRIPPANIQTIFARMEPVSLRTGDKVIEQGQEGDYYYVIKRGHCKVTRKTRNYPKGVKLATLGVGDSFGEEALITDTKRNATVTMLSDGEMMRLSKEDFTKLLQEPLLNWLGYKEASAMVEEQGAKFLDVRLPAEFEQRHLEGSVNIPFFSLRMRLKQLEREAPFVLVCDTGSRSSAAAFLLNERGYEAFVLRGGLNKLPAGVLPDA
ncbi:MAG: cyclic nucleotide-binding domain-containing protein [Gammaproteobacteria bacterium]|jgi:CRP-like cAMP-binding protein|nr:cyclic nucleotide-binding domain-containing protein [Gammaproteobacteria bacterium]